MAAALRNIPVVLGTVPEEDPDLIPIRNMIFRGNPAWAPQNLECVRQVNEVIRYTCGQYRNCHILDLHGMVEHIKDPDNRVSTSGKFVDKDTKVEGEELYSYSELRPDGVHLSEVGSEIAARLLHDSLLESSPTCRNKD